MVVLGAGATAGYKAVTKPAFADVVAVKEVVDTVSTPKERCEDVQVKHQAPIKDEHRIAGSVVGGIAGGLLGSNIGGGKGKTLATSNRRVRRGLRRQPGPKESAIERYVHDDRTSLHHRH